MPKIIYYVATSLDGFICGPNEDTSRFVAAGDGIEKYLRDLDDFKTVIMGRKTYEFGYQFGLKPGDTPYKHMENHIFSTSLEFETKAENIHIEKLDLNRVREIRDKSDTEVYLCGGGRFAGWLLDNDLIDQLKIKLNPIILGGGTRLFGNSQRDLSLNLLQRESFNDIEILTYEVLK